MPTTIDREEVQRLVREGAQLVEVLPAEEYEHEHIAGAVNMPLKQLRELAKGLDRARPIIVYCHDRL